MNTTATVLCGLSCHVVFFADFGSGCGADEQKGVEMAARMMSSMGPIGQCERNENSPKARAAFRRIRALLHGDGGMSTAEYAIGTVAAAAFAALLYTVVTGDSVAGALSSLIERALQSSF